MPPPPGSRLGAEQRSFDVGSTRATLTKMSIAGLIVRVTMSGTLFGSEPRKVPPVQCAGKCGNFQSTGAVWANWRARTAVAMRPRENAPATVSVPARVRFRWGEAGSRSIARLQRAIVLVPDRAVAFAGALFET